MVVRHVDVWWGEGLAKLKWGMRVVLSALRRSRSMMQKIADCESYYWHE